MLTDDATRALSRLADIYLAEAEANYPTDLEYDDLEYDDLGYEDLEDLQYRLGLNLSSRS